ncbi:MAG: acyltransferase [Prevotellaceae bacterium]|nr:acyltransferase [Prevotellaceae bacterium]
MKTENNRIVFLDYLRVIACFMVVMVHTCEFYYCTDYGAIPSNDTARLWLSIIDGASRQAVPLFVMASSFLLVPLTTDSTTFFKRRFSRILVPFLVWSLLYAIMPVLTGETSEPLWKRIVSILYTVNDNTGHLWFIYMLIGIYLVMPVISPWLNQVSKRGEEVFLAIWFLNTFTGYLQPLTNFVWGEVFWNNIHALYYYSGYIGYVVLAHYIRTHVNWSLKKTLAIAVPLILVGYAITGGLFYSHSLESTDYRYVEQSWYFCTFNVAMMTAGTFLLMRHVSYSAKGIYNPVKTVSKLSYGIYLMHIFILNLMQQWLAPHFSTLPAILIVGIAAFLCCILVSRLLSLLPASKWIIG